MGRAGTLLIILTTVGAPIIGVAAFFLRLLPNIIYFSIISAVLSYSGYILFLVAMNRFANHYGDRAIFSNALYGFLTSIAGAAVFMLLFFGVFPATFAPFLGTPPTPGSPLATSFFLSIISFFVIIWLGASAIALIQSLFYRRAFYALAEKSGEGNFRQAGFLMLLGGALTIMAVGAIIFFVGWIFAALGFFSMKPKYSQTYSPPQQTPPPSRVRYCPTCGAENSEGAVFCSRCGNRL